MNAKTQVPKQSAHDRYTDLHEEATLLLKRLQAKLEAHAMKEAADKSNWGYAGDMAHVVAQLTELKNFLGA